VIFSIVQRIGMLSVIYAECHIQAFHAVCQFAECHYAKCHYAECHYNKCLYAECHYTECHGALKNRLGYLPCKNIFNRQDLEHMQVVCNL
jgi:hypothetical protein